MTESYQDRLRRAAGLPTAAEKAQQAAEKRRRQQEQAAERRRRQQEAEAEAEADRPKREALATKFNEKVVPILHSAFVGAQPEFQDAKRTLSEEVSVPCVFLAQKVFTCEIEPPGVRRKQMPPRTEFPPLQFTLQVDGNIKIDIWRGRRSLSYKNVTFAARNVPLTPFEREYAETAFVEYLKAVCSKRSHLPGDGLVDLLRRLWRCWSSR